MALNDSFKRYLNLLGILRKSSYRFESENGSLKVYKGAFVFKKGILNNGLHSLIGWTIIGGTSNDIRDMPHKSEKVWRA